MTLFYIRLAVISLWGLATLCLLPSFIRSCGKQPRSCDDYRTAMFFMAVWMFANYIERIFQYQPEPQLGVLYALNALAGALAFYILILVRQGSREP